jgi:hypothetical protein
MSHSHTLDEAAAYESYLARLPEDGRARLRQPAAEDFKAPSGFSTLQCRLEANDPATGPGRFLLLMPFGSLHGYADPSSLQTEWHNMTETNRWTGGGIGFPDITRRPRIEALGPAPPQLPQFWSMGQFFIASPPVCELLRQYGSTAIDTVDIDWTFSDGVRLDGYAMLDVKTFRHSIDFYRSDIEVVLNGERRYIYQRGHRTLRADIPEGVHVFRDALDHSEVIFSRELAIALETLAPAACRFMDFQLRLEVPLALERILKQRSIFKRQQVAASELQDLHEQLKSDVVPRIRAGDFVAAEKELVRLIRSTDPSPYHIVCELEITTPAESAARYLDDFAKRAQSEHPLGAIYCEVNSFTINTDRWFFDASGFPEDGGRDDLEWLGDFASESKESQVITGLGALQTVFADSMIDREGGFERARLLCEALVIVKFQKMLHEARALMKYRDVSMLAAAHDYDEYLAEIPRLPTRRGWFR